MVPVLIGLGIAAAVAGLAALVIKFLGWDKVTGWFRGRQKLLEADKANIAFTLQQSLASGNYGTVQGIFNTSTSELVNADAGQKYEAEDVAQELKDAHKNNELVVYS
jgi:hypothetical protein